MIDRLAAIADRLAHPPLQFVIGLWGVVCWAAGLALTQRTVVEQWNSLLFIGAGALFVVALVAPRSIGKLTFAFAGFGLAACATFARTASAIPVAQTVDGAAIILAAWVLLTYKALQRTAATFLVITEYRR